MIHRVEITDAAKKDLRACPPQIQKKFRIWVETVELIGVEEARKQGGKGLHDEPLREPRKGQRSIRLSQGYRAFYKVLKNGTVEFLSVIEVNKHKY
jgi:mRNA-degrading endonuclease RelE of RelBE toxin-antitoxin system